MDRASVGEDGAVRIAAPAKINLYLHVIGRRDDGYHELDSLVAFADIGDAIAATPASGLSLRIDGPFAPALSGDAAENLVLRAAQVLAEHVGIAPRASLSLTKNLPVASGIGGGSSDAAATLRALAALWRLRIADDALSELALRLGADVPVCLAGRPAWLAGIGERVEPAPPLPPLAILLANPGVALSTPAVFKARRGPFSTPGRLAQLPSDTASFLAWLRGCNNDLTDAAIGLVPAVGELLTALAAADGVRLARMSGSGATCFALFDTLAAAERAAMELRAAQPRWWVAGWLSAGQLLR
jgi:4-diphosphocytidyl-2-C-methyl-D-erythritol kinase